MQLWTPWKLWEILGGVLKNTHFLYILLGIFNFGHYKLHISSITLHVRVELKSQYVFLVGAKPFPVSYQNVKYEYCHCALQIFRFETLVHSMKLIIHIDTKIWIDFVMQERLSTHIFEPGLSTATFKVAAVFHRCRPLYDPFTVCIIEGISACIMACPVYNSFRSGECWRMYRSIILVGSSNSLMSFQSWHF